MVNWKKLHLDDSYYWIKKNYFWLILNKNHFGIVEAISPLQKPVKQDLHTIYWRDLEVTLLSDMQNVTTIVTSGLVKYSELG